MSLLKVVERKTAKVKTQKEIHAKRDQIVLTFRDYVASNLDATLFPAIQIGVQYGEIVGNEIVHVSNYPHITKGFYDSTYNIVFAPYSDIPCFHIGYGVNSCNGSFGIKIPFDYGMTKSQLKKVFKQCLEALVSKAYRVKS